MTDEMVALLRQEQAEEDGEQRYHADGVDETEDEGKTSVADVQSPQGAISDFKNQLDATGARLEAVRRSAAKLGASADEALTTRESEHFEFRSVAAYNAHTWKLRHRNL